MNLVNEYSHILQPYSKEQACRYDWYQMGSFVVISLFAKACLPEQCSFQANATTVSVYIHTLPSLPSWPTSLGKLPQKEATEEGTHARTGVSRTCSGSTRVSILQVKFCVEYENGKHCYEQTIKLHGVSNHEFVSYYLV